MMECTNDIARKYHIEFGAAKCKIVRIGNGPKAEVQLNDQPLEETTKYKYLGETINNKGNLKDHINELKGKITAAVQKILIETGDKEFKGIKMRAIWELVETSIIPIITYGSEGWNMTKEESKQIQAIFNTAIKDILQLPQGTPTSILLAETGFLPIELIIKKKKIKQHIRIMEKPEDKLIRKATENQNTIWKQEIENLLQEYGIEDIQIPINKIAMNEHINKHNIETFRKQIEKERESNQK